MQVFHGSYAKIDEVDLSKSMPNRDFGQGFYVTKFRKQAESWAKNIGLKYDTEGFVTEFTYYDSLFTERLCKVKHFNNYNNEWLDFVVMNRNPLSHYPAHDYDIVEGPVADDKVQRYLNRYISGKIPKEQFLKQLSYHEPTHQICFCTMRSLLVLKKNDETEEMSYNIEEIGEPVTEKLMQDLKVDETKAFDIFYSSETFSQLADIKTKLHEQSWQQIYEILKKELKL